MSAYQHIILSICDIMIPLSKWKLPDLYFAHGTNKKPIENRPKKKGGSRCSDDRLGLDLIDMFMFLGGMNRLTTLVMT